MGLGLSIEVCFILYFIILIMFLITVFNMEKIKEIRTVNEKLDNNSDGYKKNQNIIWRKVFKSFLFISISEFVYCIFNDMSRCVCGFSQIDMLPILNFAVLQSIISIYILKTLKKRNYTIRFLSCYMIISVLLFIITIILFKNDLNALHRLK